MREANLNGQTHFNSSQPLQFGSLPRFLPLLLIELHAPFRQNQPGTDRIAPASLVNKRTQRLARRRRNLLPNPRRPAYHGQRFRQVDGGRFGDGVRQTGAGGLYACEGGGGDEGAGCTGQVRFAGVQEPEVRFHVVEEAFVREGCQRCFALRGHPRANWKGALCSGAGNPVGRSLNYG